MEPTASIGRALFDWDEIERFYVQDESLPSYRGTSKIFKVNLSTLIKHANKGDWQKKREEYWSEVNEKVFKKVKTFTIANRVQRFTKVSKTINKVITNLSKQSKIREATVQDLAKLMDIEARLLDAGGTADKVDDDTVAEIVQMQITRIRAIKGDRSANLNRVLNAGLKRLGFAEGETPSDGDTPQRQGVRVRTESS